MVTGHAAVVGAVLSSFDGRFNDFEVSFHRSTGEHSEEDHGEAVSSACGGQAAQHGFGVWEARALQEEESRGSRQERRGGNGEIPFEKDVIIGSIHLLVDSFRTTFGGGEETLGLWKPETSDQNCYRYQKVFHKDQFWDRFYWYIISMILSLLETTVMLPFKQMTLFCVVLVTLYNLQLKKWKLIDHKLIISAFSAACD